MGRARRLRAGPGVFLGGCAALALGGCGYSMGGMLQEEGVRTVAVEVVANESFRQRFEIPLTRRIVEDLTVHSALVPASRGRADAVLQVVVEDVAGQVLSEGGGAPIREGALLAGVSVRLVERRTGRTLREAKLSERAEYRVPVGERRADAQEELVRDLARLVILALEPGF